MEEKTQAQKDFEADLLARGVATPIPPPNELEKTKEVKSLEAPTHPLPEESGELDLFTRAKEITNQEVLTTTEYNKALSAGNPSLARALLFAGYLAEHYRALVGNRKPTDEELLRYRTLLDDFERLLRRPPEQPYP